MILPPLIFFGVCLLEMGIGKAWLADKLSFDFILTLFGECLVLLLFIFGMLETQIRIGQRSKRVIQIEDKKIKVKPAKNQLIRWNRISKFQFEPIPEMPELMKLKLFLHGRPNQKLSERAFWSMVLAQPEQVKGLVECLQKRQMETPTNYEVEVLEKSPPPEHPTPFPYLGLSLYLGGFYLLIHGLPLLLIGLANRGHHYSEDDSDLTLNQKAKLGRFILKHFSSLEEMRYFFIVAGGVLMLLGLWLMIWGWLLMNRNKSLIRTS